VPATVPHDASLTYAKNIANFVALIVHNKALHLDVDDPIVRETVTTHDGQVVHVRVREALGLDPLPAPPAVESATPTGPSREAVA
jgi:NAD(P) transhydrogenase subunit alpha